MTGVMHFIELGWADEVDGRIISEAEENNVCMAQFHEVALN